MNHPRGKRAAPGLSVWSGWVGSCSSRVSVSVVCGGCWGWGWRERGFLTVSMEPVSEIVRGRGARVGGWVVVQGVGCEEERGGSWGRGRWVEVSEGCA